MELVDARFGSRVRFNALQQPIGPDLGNWTVPSPPEQAALDGRTCRLEPLDVGSHARELFEAYRADQEGRSWTYLAYGPFPSFEDYVEWLRKNCLGQDPLFFAIRDLASGTSLGVASYLRIEPAMGSIEVGHLAYAPALQRTPAGTEAMYLMMRHAFELGYRRYEWKCDALNAPSRRAAERYGFRYEGIFRQGMVYNGRNRDTAWYSVLDAEWPRLRARFERWLDPHNFDAHGAQRTTLDGVPVGTGEEPPLTLRTATLADVLRIVELLADDDLGRTREDPGPPLPGAYLEAFLDIDQDPRNVLLVAERAQRIVGTLQLTYLAGLTYRGGERALLEGVRVAREERGQGIGRQLVQAAIGRARERGCALVQLTSDLSRKRAQRFYESLGFVCSHVGMKLCLDAND